MLIPLITVVLIVGKQRERGTRCLQSLLAQTAIDQLEVLVFDDEMETEAPLSGSTHPAVRLLPMPAIKHYGHVLIAGLEQARAPVVALIEEHCIAFPGWAQALIQAHQGPYAVVSGEVYNDNPGRGASDLIYCDYWATIPPRSRGETTSIIRHNTSYKVDVLLKYGDKLVDLLQNELMLAWHLQQDGYKLFAEPEAKIAHANETYYRSHQLGLYLSNRTFGALRARTYHSSILRRAFYILIVPMAPFIRLARQLAILRKERPKLLPLTLQNLANLWAFHAAAVVGQAVGLIWGEGDAGERFLQFELNEYRDIDGIHVRRLFTRVRG